MVKSIGGCRLAVRLNANRNITVAEDRNGLCLIQWTDGWGTEGIPDINNYIPRSHNPTDLPCASSAEEIAL